MASDISVLNLPLKSYIDDSDYLLAIVSSQCSRITVDTLLSAANQWQNISGRPYDTVDTDCFAVTVDINSGEQILTLSSNITKDFHTHSNQSIINNISENSSGELTYKGNSINGKSKNYTGTFSVDGWSTSAPYTQTVSVKGLKADVPAIIDVIVSDNLTVGLAETNAWSKITKVVTDVNTVTAYCYDGLPSVTLNFTVKEG